MFCKLYLAACTWTVWCFHTVKISFFQFFEIVNIIITKGQIKLFCFIALSRFNTSIYKNIHYCPCLVCDFFNKFFRSWVEIFLRSTQIDSDVLLSNKFRSVLSFGEKLLEQKFEETLLLCRLKTLFGGLRREK